MRGDPKKLGHPVVNCPSRAAAQHDVGSNCVTGAIRRCSNSSRARLSMGRFMSPDSIAGGKFSVNVADLTGQIRDLGTRICPDIRVADLAGGPAVFRSVMLV